MALAIPRSGNEPASTSYTLTCNSHIPEIGLIIIPSSYRCLFWGLIEVTVCEGLNGNVCNSKPPININYHYLFIYHTELWVAGESRLCLFLISGFPFNSTMLWRDFFLPSMHISWFIKKVREFQMSNKVQLVNGQREEKRKKSFVIWEAPKITEKISSTFGRFWNLSGSTGQELGEQVDWESMGKACCLQLTSQEAFEQTYKFPLEKKVQIPGVIQSFNPSSPNTLLSSPFQEKEQNPKTESRRCFLWMRGADLGRKETQSLTALCLHLCSVCYEVCHLGLFTTSPGLKIPHLQNGEGSRNVKVRRRGWWERVREGRGEYAEMAGVGYGPSTLALHTQCYDTGSPGITLRAAYQLVTGLKAECN